MDASIRLREFDDKRNIATKKLERAAKRSRDDRERKAMSLSKTKD